MPQLSNFFSAVGGGHFESKFERLHRSALLLITSALTHIYMHTHECKDAVSNLIKNRKQPKVC